MSPQEMLETLRGWLSEIAKDFTIIETPLSVLGRKLSKGKGWEIRDDIPPSDGMAHYSAQIFTATNIYRISANFGEGGSYLGCTTTSRMPRAGEDWSRGNDLPDGEFCRETWDAISRAILRYETVDIHARPSNDLSGKVRRPDELERMCRAVAGIKFVRIDDCPDEASYIHHILMTAMPFAVPLSFNEVFDLCIDQANSLSTVDGELVRDIRPTELLIEILRGASCRKIHMFKDGEDPSEDIERARSRRTMGTEEGPLPPS